MRVKVVTILGARPQFIKAAAVSREMSKNINRDFEEVIIHTGQHSDRNMSDIFFEELNIPHPRYNLNISGLSHGEMTARMLSAIEKILLEENPNWVLIYGDTNSTLAGALAACKLHIPIAHVEAGLRSFNMRMPEEINRILSDRVSHALFCPTEIAIQNLKNEGLTENVYNVGDVMYDAFLYYDDDKFKKNETLETLGLEKRNYVLITCHRAENTDYKYNLENILAAVKHISLTKQVVFPLHPRTRNLINQFSLSHYLNDVKILDPLSYLEMLCLEKNAEVIVTDSGGIQKEANFFKVPCVTMRDETEWKETLTEGTNKLAGASREQIIACVLSAGSINFPQRSSYGDGKASQKILNILRELTC